MTAFIRSLISPIACLLMAATLWAMPNTSQADESPVAVLAAASTQWSALTTEQKKLLAPLAQQWTSMDDAARAKWIQVTNRYPSLPPSAQQRIEARMQQWASMSSDERNQARLRYQQARQLSPEERQQRWKAYRALPDSERKDLARVGIRKQNPVLLDEDQAGPPEIAQMRQMNTSKLQSAADGSKNNLVSAPNVASPALVAPATIRSGTGATTSFVNQTATTPAHQQVGLPKINTDQSFVAPNTLLPLRGPQGAGMTPVGK